MAENERYFERMWGEEYYIFDSQTISEKEFDEKIEYEEYQAFSNSMTGDEVVKLLNELDDKCEFLEIENEALEDAAIKYAERYHESLKENRELKQKVNFYKYFQKDARELEKENEQLKHELKLLSEFNQKPVL